MTVQDQQYKLFSFEGEAKPRWVQVGAVADWLLGTPVGQITHKWSISRRALNCWLKPMRRHFKSRR